MTGNNDQISYQVANAFVFFSVIYLFFLPAVHFDGVNKTLTACCYLYGQYIYRIPLRL